MALNGNQEIEVYKSWIYMQDSTESPTTQSDNIFQNERSDDILIISKMIALIITPIL